jgi:hypothetical protein
MSQINPDLLSKLHTEFDLRFQDDQQVESAYFNIDVNNIDAQIVYDQLRSQGISDARTLGQKIFGVNGGRKWSAVSQILFTWSAEYESQSNTVS